MTCRHYRSAAARPAAARRPAIGAAVFWTPIALLELLLAAVDDASEVSAEVV